MESGIIIILGISIYITLQVVLGIGRILNSHFEPSKHVQFKSWRAHHEEMRERDEGNTVCDF